MTNTAFGRKVTTWAIAVLMLAVVCFDVVATPDDGKLGEQARRAIGQWPAAQQADEDWGWVRTLVYLVQIALSAQGFDPGKPDGLMGPNTMMALLAWRGEKGAPVAVDLWPSLGIADIVAQLLHVTLESMGLSAGPRDQVLGLESAAALERWDDTFTSGALSMDIGDHDLARKMVMQGFGPGAVGGRGGDEKQRTARFEGGQTNRSRGTDKDQERSAGYNSDKDATHCVKFTWDGERWDWRDDDYQIEIQDFRVVNTCDFRIWFAWKGNGLAFPPDQNMFYFRPPVSSCSLADDQQYPPSGGIMDVRTVDQSGPHFPLHVNGRMFLLKGDIVARVSYCAQVYEEELEGQVDWHPPDCVYRVPRPCGNDSGRH